jgi:hypothetical protein
MRNEIDEEAVAEALAQYAAMRPHGTLRAVIDFVRRRLAERTRMRQWRTAFVIRSRIRQGW